MKFVRNAGSAVLALGILGAMTQIHAEQQQSCPHGQQCQNNGQHAQPQQRSAPPPQNTYRAPTNNHVQPSNNGANGTPPRTFNGSQPRYSGRPNFNSAQPSSNGQQHNSVQPSYKAPHNLNSAPTYNGQHNFNQPNINARRNLNNGLRNNGTLTPQQRGLQNGGATPTRSLTPRGPQSFPGRNLGTAGNPGPTITRPTQQITLANNTHAVVQPGTHSMTITRTTPGGGSLVMNQRFVNGQPRVTNAFMVTHNAAQGTTTRTFLDGHQVVTGSGQMRQLGATMIGCGNAA